MKYLLIFTVGVCLVLSTAMMAQEAPKPGPEHKKLADLRGSWTCEGEDSSGKSSGTVSCKWSDGEFFMLCEGPWNAVSGARLKISQVYGYDPNENAYTLYRYWSNGWSDFSKGWIKDSTWTFVFENERVDDKVRRRQMTMEFAPDSFTMKWEHSVEGEPWHVTTRGKCTRAKDTTN